VLDFVAPATGLGVVYLLAVLGMAIRRGGVAALATAVVGVLALNYFFIAPIHRLTIADPENVAALGVFLIVAVVVGRLAAAGRQREAEAHQRAQLAQRREREAALLADAAGSILADPELAGQMARLGAVVGEAVGGEAHLVLASAAAGTLGERTLRLPTKARPAWLLLRAAPSWADEDLERLREPLARLVDLAVERDRLAGRAAESEAARRAAAARTAILHAISHDLRTPLTSITAAAGALGAAELPPGDRHELAEVVGSEATRLSRLVDDLLDLSRIQAGAVEPQEDWCDLAEVIAGAAEHVRAARGEHAIEVALPGDLPLVRADAAQLERVFGNLIENAVKFSPPSEPVRITGGTGGGRVVVRVTDRGRGIPLRDRHQVFEPFFQSRRDGAGSGLGLAITRGFVEANGGRVIVQAPPEGGTSFAVSFPLVVQPAPAP
jgi:two-component system, OmpR family, sensor histidine kinase KdpD